MLTAAGVVEYIQGIEGLSDEAKRQVVEGYLGDLSARAEHFLERYPLQHESYLFECEFALIEGDLVYTFRFIADGSHMAMGVVHVVYVDHQTLSEPS